MSRIPSIGLITLLVLVAALGYAQAPDLASMDIVLKSIPDGPAAMVNGVNIGRQDFINLYQAELKRLSVQNGGGTIQDGERIKVAIESLRVLLRAETLHQEALRRSIEIPEGQIEEEWVTELERLRRNLAGQGGSQLSEDEVLALIGVENRGQAFAQIERMMLIDAISDLIVAESEGEMTVTDEEVAAVFDKQRAGVARLTVYRVRQILILAQEDSTAEERTEARAKIDQALARLQSGESFSGLAKELSDDPRSESGGEMVGTDREFPPFVTEAVATMAAGEISGVVVSEFGFHLFQLVERKTGSDGTLEEAAPIIRERLMAVRGDRVVREYCTQLWEAGMPWEHYLEINKNLSINSDYREQALE